MQEAENGKARTGWYMIMNEKQEKRKEGCASDDLISVIVPIYNIKDCLPKCVESICAQTYPHLEILLVDDGSNDGTEQLVDELAKKDKRIRVFHKENGGSSSARNLGISKAKGKWIGFVDSDDFIEPEMYEELLRALLEYKVPMAQVSRDEIDQEGKKLADVCQPPEKAYICQSEQFMRELLLHRGDCSFCTKLTDRRLLEQKQFPVGVLNEDFHLLVELLQEMEGAVILPGQLYHVFYRIGSNTRKKTKNEFSRVFIDIVNNADMAEKTVKEKYPALRKEAVRFGLYQRLDYMLHIPVEMMTGDNEFYKGVKRYLRTHLPDTVSNPYLTGKNKVYLLLLTVMPKPVRRIHRAKMRRTQN